MTYRAVICSLLVLLMIISFSACERTTGDEDLKESDALTETGESSAPSEQTPGEPSAAVSIPSDPPEDRPDLVIFDWDEYVTRPHEIKPGTVLNYAAPNDVPPQLPWSSSYDRWLWGNIFEGLLYMYMNDPADIRGCIAESWTHSDDYLTWTFHIRDGVKFTDGTACDAAAIAKAWDFAFSYYEPHLTDYNIKSWEAAAEDEFVVRLSSPCGYFEAALCGNTLLIVSPTALGLFGTDDTRAAVGTGPYFIESFSPHENIILRANADYDFPEKMPCIQTVNFIIFKDENEIVPALLSGDADGAKLDIYGAELSIAERCDCLVENGYGGNLAACLGTANAVWLNAEKVPVFRQHEVREALCRFIDFNAINDELYGGMGRVQDSIWAEGSSGYVPTDQFYYDPDEGHALLASVGADASDIEFRAEIYASVNEYSAIQNALSEAGVKMELYVLRTEDSAIPFFKGNWTIQITNMLYDNSAPYARWKYILPIDPYFKLCWQDVYNPDLYQKMLDEYYRMILASQTWEEALAHSKQLTAYVQDDFGAIGGVQPPAFLALSKDFKNGIYFSEQHDIQLYYLYQ